LKIKIIIIFFLFCFPPGKILAQDGIDYFIVDSISLEGNKQTKDHILYRELLFSEGDTIFFSDTANVFNQSEENLVNTSLFNFASIQSDTLGSITVSVTERWYIWPGVYWTIEERNFNVWLRNPTLEKVTYGLYFEHENFRGRKENLKLLFKTGYNQLAGFAFQAPYVNKSRKLGLFVVSSVSGSHAINYKISDHEFVSVKSDTAYLFSSIRTDAGLTWREGIHQSHKLTVGFNNLKTVSGVLSLNPSFMPAENLSMLSLNYQFRLDYRNYRSYPLKGWYFDVEFNLGGLIGISEEKMQNYFLKSSTDKYFQIVPRLYWASGMTFLTRFDKVFYYAEMTAMGLNNDYVRGYEYYLIPSRHFLLQKNNLKLEVFKPRIFRLPWIKADKFAKVPVSLYMNLFFDYAHSWAYPGVFDEFNDQWQYGYGIGLDLVTYYDKVFRLEYSINRFNENGVFLHFTAPI